MYTVGRAGEEMVRAIGMLSLDPNEFAMIILPTMIWALYRLLCGRKILEIAVLTALNMILLMAFVMAVSRTGTVLYLTGIIMLLFLRRGDSSTGSKTSKRLKLFISTVVRLNLLVALVLATDMLGAGQFFESLRIRFDSSIYEGQYGSRDVLSVRTLQLFLEHPMGVGLNNSPDYIDGNDPHNDYLRFLAENGIIGGLFMFFAVILLLKNIYQYYRKGEETWLVVSVVLMLLATGVFQGFSKRSFFFIYSFFIVAPSLVYGAKTVTRKAGVKFKRTLNNG
jgi:O-antigen ligase